MREQLKEKRKDCWKILTFGKKGRGETVNTEYAERESEKRCERNAVRKGKEDLEKHM